MKNVKHMTKAESNQQPSSSPDLTWSEEWVPLDSVIQLPRLQARKRLNDRAVTMYANMTKEGSLPPPIKVARCGGRLYLLDGWHRMAAGALQLAPGFPNGPQVLALVAPMPESRMPWEAARCNLGHGVQYRAGEFRAVYAAFIKSKQHHKRRGELMSYREMAAAFGMGVSHVTLRRWTEADHPKLFKALSSHDHGNEEAGAYPTETMTMEQQHNHEARRAATELRQHAEALACPQNRWELLESLEACAAMLKAKGVEQPSF